MNLLFTCVSFALLSYLWISYLLGLVTEIVFEIGIPMSWDLSIVEVKIVVLESTRGQKQGSDNDWSFLSVFLSVILI
jgi:hypothetical protein